MHKISQELGNRQRSFTNPYRAIIREFPGRIFLFEEFEKEITAIRNICRDRLTIVELGCGSGQHLIARAVANPSAICLGLEVRYKRCVRVIEKATHRGADHLYILRVDARELQRIFTPRSIDQLYVLFPDPWRKRREQKHRLLSANFLKECQPLLGDTGSLTVKTDAEEYFSWFLEQVKQCTSYTIVELSRDIQCSEFAATKIVTEFASMFLSQGLAINYAKLTHSLAT